MNKLNLTKYINIALKNGYEVGHNFPLRRIDGVNYDIIVFGEGSCEIELAIATVFTDVDFIEGIERYIENNYSDIKKYNLGSLSQYEMIDYITTEHAIGLRDNSLLTFIKKILNNAQIPC